MTIGLCEGRLFLLPIALANIPAMEWYQWVLILVLLGLIAAWVIIRKKQQNQ